MASNLLVIVAGITCFESKSLRETDKVMIPAAAFLSEIRQLIASMFCIILTLWPLGW